MTMGALTTTLAAPAVARGVTVDVATDAPGFDRLHDEWDGLLQGSAAVTPFLNWSWLRNWWRHLAGAATLQLFVVREGGELIGVAPLMLTRRGLQHSPVLEFLGTGGAGSDYLDAVVRRGHEHSAIAALTSAIHALQLPLYLDHLPPAPVAGSIQVALAARGWAAIESHPDVCPVIALAGHSWDSYLATLGAAHRANVRRRLRSLAANFDVRFGAVETERDRRAALAALIEFSTVRWAERGGTTAFDSPQLRAFHEATTKAALADGSLRLYVLTLNGDIAAVMYGFMRSQRFYFYQHGFSPAFARLSVGLVLMALTIKAAIEEATTEFDLLYGHEPYKRLWARDCRRLGRLQLFPPRITGTLLRREVETRQALRALASRLGLRQHEGAW
jgi:CelD/BcsL family acetyltransferase involved in cellulose biosynthesis